MAHRDQSRLDADVCVIGAGLAGLYTALCAAAEGASVAVVTRSTLAESSSYFAQGGVAAALSAADSPERHFRDTLEVGRGACRRSAVEVLAANAAREVDALRDWGVAFDTEGAGLALGLEGGHSRRRIAHSGGAQTGRRITATLAELASASEQISIIERASVASLSRRDGRCLGAVAGGAEGAQTTLTARATVLATGGAAALWQRTTNPAGASGSGLALAHDAGAALADLELVQFHPTSLAVSGDLDGFLISEAVRGEGALLLNQNHERFVDELAGRDEVAVAICDQLATEGAAVYLDMRSIRGARFASLCETIKRAGIDPASELVPVAPAAHYTIGGVKTDVFGRTTLRGLYAVGECACTGVHGANRLASNSLAECLVFGRRAALCACEEACPAGPAPVSSPGPAHEPPSAELARSLWRLAGITRTQATLDELARQPALVARLIAVSGLLREETRGVHRRADCPETDSAFDQLHTVVSSDGGCNLERWL